MSIIINISQIILALLLITFILLQHRGTGLGGAFGSEGGVYRSKRGVEKVLYNITIIIAILFIVLAIINVRY